MSDSIEHDGKHYVEIGYLELANRNTKRYHHLAIRLEQELATEKARLNKLLSLRTPYFVRGENHVRLVETDCGAMIVHGEGRDERAAIDAAIKADMKPNPKQREWSDESMRSAMLDAAKENGADV